ncbi:MAG: AraC family transcriptional regulator [Clostridia bacterium BRH_c25]|nr:MAG: AraC family transcriptional regulator [Clostridia bacterium BRH_c25]
MGFLQQLDDALDYIEENLAGNISFDQAAKIACCSTYYFQRMFSYIAGVPLSEYIRRRRMTAAAFDLQDNNAKISEIAVKYGYNSPTSFNRAFQSVHGVAPSAVWGREAFLTTYPRLRLHISVTGDEQMKYRIETKKPIRIVGVRMTLSADVERNFTEVPKFWHKTRSSSTFTQFGKLMNQSPEGMLGTTIYNRLDDISYVIGVASDKPVPDGMVECQIPGLTWAVFQCIGPMPYTFQELYRRFYSEWLPVSDYNYTNGPDMEVYTENNTTSPTYKCELWMAVTKK